MATLLVNKMASFRLFWPILILFFSNCGLTFTPGPQGTSNATRPSGNPIEQANIYPSNGQTGITGSALIFLSSGAYILRLEGLNITSQPGLMIQILYTPSGTVNLSLSNFTGNQNYTFTAPVSGIKFNAVYIISTVNNNLQYASALFP